MNRTLGQPARRKIAWACTIICTALVVFVAVLGTVDPGRLTLSGILRIDLPAIAAILGFRVYRNSSGRKP